MRYFDAIFAPAKPNNNPIVRIKKDPSKYMKTDAPTQIIKHAIMNMIALFPTAASLFLRRRYAEGLFSQRSHEF